MVKLYFRKTEEGGDRLKKKKILFSTLILALIGSSIFIYDSCFPLAYLASISMAYKIVVWIVTIILLVFYLKYPSKPQLVPSVLITERETNREKDRSTTSFNDVAGLEEKIGRAHV